MVNTIRGLAAVICQASATWARGTARVSTLSFAGPAAANTLGDGFEQSGERHAFQSTAHEHDGRRAQRGRGQADVRLSGRGPYLHEAHRRGVFSEACDGGDEGEGALAPEIIDDDIDTGGEVLCHLLLEVLFVSGIAEGDEDVRAERLEGFERMHVAASDYDFACAEVLCKLHGECAGRAGCAVDQHGFAGLQLRAQHERGPGGHARIGERGGGDIVERIGYGHAAAGAYERALGHCAERCFGQHEVDAAAVLGAAYAVGAGYGGVDGVGAIVGAGGPGLGELGQCGGGDGDDLVAGARFGLVEVGVDRWGSGCGDQGGFHRDTSGILAASPLITMRL